MILLTWGIEFPIQKFQMKEQAYIGLNQAQLAAILYYAPYNILWGHITKCIHDHNCDWMTQTL